MPDPEPRIIPSPDAPPGSATYVAESSVRHELSEAFDLCGGCRRCTDLCGVFPTLFDLLDRLPDGEPGRMTPAEQDDIMEHCFECGRCLPGCPYADASTASGEARLDMPALALRAAAMRRAGRHQPPARRFGETLLARVPQRGVRGAAVRRVANPVSRARPGGAVRRVAGAATGLSADVRMPSAARQRFSSWLARSATPSTGQPTADSPHRTVLFVPTCIIERHEPGIGQSAVELYRADGADIEVVDLGCCGAPQLQVGDVDGFRATAERNLAKLAELPADQPIVVGQPTCADTIKRLYLEHRDAAQRTRTETDRAGADRAVADRAVADRAVADRAVADRAVADRAGADRAVADRVVDLVDDLTAVVMRLVGRAADVATDAGVAGDADGAAATGSRSAGTVVCHQPCRSTTGGRVDGAPALLAAAGFDVEVVAGCSGMGGLWGLQRHNAESSAALASVTAAALTDAIGTAEGATVGQEPVAVVGSCASASARLADELGVPVEHPVTMVARRLRQPS